MTVADSPLRDRVVFVQGAPRSGTTLLVMLLASHPQIAGVEAESHLFEYGVDHLFDNFEGRHRDLRGLRTYLERNQLIDLVRELCDGVFLASARNLGVPATPDFVVEKTPTSISEGALQLSRKRECYPDGWYLHIVRDGDAVARSLMRAPWVADRTYESCKKLWSDCVETTREHLGDHPRYREVSFEALVDDHVAVAAELFDWLGIDSGDDVRGTIKALSQERFSELGAVPAPAKQGGARTAASVARRMIGRLSRSANRPKLTRTRGLSFHFVSALRTRDRDALVAMTTESFELTLRTPEGDLCTRGDEARAGLIRVADELFVRRAANEWWASAEGGPREWWTRAPGHELWTILYSAIAEDATRVDVAFGLTPHGDRIAEAVVLTVGPLTGRPLQELGPT